MFDSIWIEVKTFFKNPLKAIFDPNASTIYQVEKMVEQGKTEAEIDQALKSTGFVKGSTADDIVTGVKDFVRFTAKNLPTLVIAVILIIVTYYVIMFRRSSA